MEPLPKINMSLPGWRFIASISRGSNVRTRLELLHVTS